MDQDVRNILEEKKWNERDRPIHDGCGGWLTRCDHEGYHCDQCPMVFQEDDDAVTDALKIVKTRAAEDERAYQQEMEWERQDEQARLSR